MNSNGRSAILFGALFTCAIFTDFGWDNPRHMAVAGLAYDELSSAEQAKQVVPGDHGDQLVAQIDDAYIQTATIDAKQRIRVAGHRLALILKQALQ